MHPDREKGRKKRGGGNTHCRNDDDDADDGDSDGDDDGATISGIDVSVFVRSLVPYSAASLYETPRIRIHCATSKLPRCVYRVRCLPSNKKHLCFPRIVKLFYSSHMCLEVKNIYGNIRNTWVRALTWF